MHALIAADALEKFVIATPTSALWSGLASSGAIVLVIIASVALLAYLLLLMRPPSRARVVCGFVAAIGFNLIMPGAFAFLALSEVPVVLRAVFMVVPLIAFAFVLHGIVWIARHWRVFDPTRCGVCNHQLLRDQIECPECGAARRLSPVWGWAAEQSRVTARMLLAVLCVMISLYAVGAVGVMKLEWHARLFVEIFDENDAELATILADAMIVERVVAADFGEGYGPKGLVRDIRGAAAASPGGNNQTMVFESLQPRNGSPLDEAWLAALPSQLASFPPASAEASSNWMRTVAARLGGGSASFGSDIRTVQTTIDLRHPSGFVILAVMCAGPVGAGLIALVLKGFVGRMLRKAQASTHAGTTRASG